MTETKSVCRINHLINTHICIEQNEQSKMSSNALSIELRLLRNVDLTPDVGSVWFCEHLFRVAFTGD